jgi:hypothetical protein
VVLARSAAGADASPGRRCHGALRRLRVADGMAHSWPKRRSDDWLNYQPLRL